MKYLAIAFIIAPNTEVARDLLTYMAGDAGCETFEETDEGIIGYAQDSLFDEQQLNAQLSDFPLPDVSITYTVTEAENKDWNETWEQEGFEPIVIGDRCLVYDAKHAGTHTPDEAQIAIGIDAKMAFGTGTHETTQLMVSTLLDYSLSNKRVLDCGTGTGILGIVASKAGAASVTAYDIDEWSVENARHNAKLNGVENMEVLLGDAKVLSHVNGVFDIVLANINRNILLSDMHAYKDILNLTGVLILSGFYEQDIPLLVDKASSFGLIYTERKKLGEWCCLVFSAS